MQIVIELSEEDYNSIDGCICVYGDAIKNGIVLPKGHGRLIDADRLLRPDMIRMCYHLKNGDTAMPIIDIEHAETVIPADKGDAE